MANTATTSESSFDILEGYFKKYPDVPKETILKQHLLSLGHWFSDAALQAAEGALVKSYRLFSYDLVPMSEFKRNEHRRVPEHFVTLNGPYGMRPVAIQTSLSPYSPYLIDVVDGRLVMTTEGHIVSEVRFPKTPDYYAKSLPDGTPYHEIVAFGAFITIFRNCQYWGAKEECKFCDINENARQMKLSRDFTLAAPVKSLEDVMLVCEEVISDARRLGVAGPGFVLSGGSITKTLHGKSEVDFYEEYIRAIKDTSSKPRITFEVNARPREEVKRVQSRRRRSTSTSTWRCGISGSSPGSIPAKPSASAGTIGCAGCATRWKYSVRATSSRVSSRASKWRGRTASRPSTKRSSRLPAASNI